MKIKKPQRSIFKLATAVLLTFAFVTPTSNVQAAPKEIVLNHWSWLDASDGETWEKMVNAFNTAHKGKGVQIKLQVFPGDRVEYNTKVLAGVATGTAPDFGWGTGGLDSLWVKKGVVIPLDVLAKRVKLDLGDFTAQSLKVSRYQKYGNKLYMIPMDAMSIAMLVNADHVKAAGLDINKPPTNADQLLTWAKAMTVKKDGKVTRSGIMMTGSGVQPSITWGIVANQMGFQRADKYLKKACINPAAGTAAMQWVVDLFDKHGVATRDVTNRYKAFTLGEGSTFWTGPWAIGGNIDAKLNFVSVPMPQVGTKVNSTYYELGGLQVFKQKDESRYLATMSAIKWFSDNSFLWTTQGRGASVRQSIIDRPDYLTSGFPISARGAFVSSMKDANLAPIPVLAADDFEVYSGGSFISQQVANVLAGKLKVSDFMSTVCPVWQKGLNEG